VRLSEETLGHLPPAVRIPAYDRRAVRMGVLHFGPGAFHRAHQAAYLDRILHRDPRFGIYGVSLRTPDVSRALDPQDGLYTLALRQAEPEHRVIGALKQVVCAAEAPDRVLAALASPDLRLISATVTEKGYGLAADGTLDLEHADIRRDLTSARPVSFVGWLVEGLRLRRAAGLKPPAVLSCDNLSDNGGKLARAAVSFAEARGEPDLARWIENEVRFPRTMVDSITPATDDDLRAEVAGALGVDDAWPVQREPFTQWVVEDQLGEDGELFAEAGVILTGDVEAFEQAKLRIVNGSHSTLAYLGLGLGHGTTAEAMADPDLAGLVERLMRLDMAPSLKPAGGLDLDAYMTEVLGRLRNPAIAHRLSQIAWDGSQKLPFRLIRPMEEALAAGRPLARLAVGLAAWMAFARDSARAGRAIYDPLSDRLAALGRACTGEAEPDVGRFLDLSAVFPRRLAEAPAARLALAEAYRNLPRRALSA
jgi:fructuronate reductase